MEREVKVILDEDVDPVTDRAIKRGLCTAFPADVAVYRKTRAWNGYDPAINAVIMESDRVVAHAAAIDKIISLGRSEVRAAGIMNVFVLPEYRNRGLARRVVDAAMAEASRQDYDCGLLFCKEWLEKVYEPMGWKTISGRTITRVVKGRELPMREHIIAMFFPLRLRELPPGDIHLLGNEW
jgi:GNAT superfamily N-acetyltransferase